MGNYPDDIRRFNNHPSSPFCDEPPCPECGEVGYDCICDEVKEEE
jgi:hypothetical protein